MRRIPQAPPAPSTDPWAGWNSKTYQIQVVTPILGGGAKAGEPEKAFAVRPSAIRGHLRFWWRTLFANGRTGKDLKDAECAIWGGQSSDGSMKASKVVVEVAGKPMTGRRISQPRDAFGFGNYPIESYAFFPAQAQQNGTPEKPLVKEGDRFEVRLSIHGSAEPEVVKQVCASFSSWVYLGGIGARTRRGMGSLKCDSLPMGLTEILGDRIKMRWAEASQPLEAWKSILKQYRNFRQCRREGKEQNRPGRSNWPEPESIRALTRERDPGHQVLVSLPGSLDLVGGSPSFPRAAFGLPIVTHFQSKTDPRDTILVPVMPGHSASDRMASPVITKPVFVNGKCFAAAIFLRTSTEPDLQVQLKANGGAGTTIGTVIDNSRIAVPNGIPECLGTSRRKDPLAAFAEYLVNNQFKSGAPA